MTPQGNLKPEFSPLSIVRMLWKGKLLILAITVLGSAISFAVVYTLPPVYHSEALVLVNAQKIPDRIVSSTVNSGFQDRLMTIRQQILTSSNLQKIIDSLGLYKEERKKLSPEEVLERMQRDITVEQEKGWARDNNGAFRVGYEGPNPTLVTEVANRLAGQFVDKNIESRFTDSAGTKGFIDSQLDAAKKDLDDMQTRVAEFQVKYNGELPQQESSLSGQLSRLTLELEGTQNDIQKLNGDRFLLDNQLTQANASLDAANRALQPHAVTRSNATKSIAKTLTAPSETHRKLEQQQKEYDEGLLRYNENYPEMVSRKAEIERLKKLDADETAKAVSDAAEAAKAQEAELAEAAKNGQPTITADPALVENLRAQQNVVSTLQTHMQLIDRDIEAKNAERERALKEINAAQAHVSRLPIRQQEFLSLTRDLEVAQGHYKSLQTQKLSAGMASDMEQRQEGEQFEIIDPARTPDRPLRPNRMLFDGMGVLASLGLAFGIAVIKEARRGAFLGEWELPEGVTILGRVPFINPQDSDDKRGNPLKKLIRPAMLWSAGLFLVCICAVGAYMFWGRA